VNSKLRITIVGGTSLSRTALILFALLSALAFSSCAKLPAGPVGQSGWTLDNNQRARLADYKGKVVVLDFYATWCEPCRAETPRLVSLQRQFAAQGLQVIGLNVGGADDRAEVPAYAKEFGIQYPLAFPDDEFADAYLSDNQSIPQAFVFDRDGNLVKRFVGYSESSAAELERVVKQSLTAGPQ
jgi:thiol-disulfide isomerase/thioredoxin